jgi:hypothetical protein
LEGGHGKIAGDVTPEYFMILEEGIASIKSFPGPLNLILMIRDPVDRAKSQIRMIIHRSSIRS